MAGLHLLLQTNGKDFLPNEKVLYPLLYPECGIMTILKPGAPLSRDGGGSGRVETVSEEVENGARVNGAGVPCDPDRGGQL